MVKADQSFLMDNLHALRRLRAAAMQIAVVACALGMIGQVLITLFGHAPSGSELSAIATAIAWCSLGSVVVIFAAIFIFWVPAHDEIIRALHRKPSGHLLTQRLPASSDFRSADQDKDTPPPRNHLH